ncbi:MAG: hypothetical protein K1566_12120 [Candidatus Thiodiazotropha sp. (ex. Lucinisca nassula)]|nr:hypothetical protein [Candidatus Thiodiazotropha sp. (ex. Lucinisca nassula)]MBW9262620.1 hypothetical protein [Candidatus Thiodiazotropha sp. (ex. Lucinisca nassula)]MBW9270378.1 hypothetical protein [Candidatus Thiodiazotropha sp. (ex. Lucinisca nassula)]
MPNIKMENLKIGKALLVAPLITPILYYLGVLMFTESEVHSPSELLRHFYFISLYALPVAYVAVINVGLPAVVMLNSKDALNVKNIVKIGTVSGATLYTAFLWLMSGFSLMILEFPKVLIYLGSGAILGLSVSFVFAWIAGIASASYANR